MRRTEPHFVFRQLKAVRARYQTDGSTTEWLNHKSVIDALLVQEIAEVLSGSDSEVEFQKNIARVYRELIYQFIKVNGDAFLTSAQIADVQVAFSSQHLNSLLYLVSAHIAEARDKITTEPVRHYVDGFNRVINLRKRAAFPNLEPSTRVNAVQLAVFLDEMALPYFQKDQEMAVQEKINTLVVALMFFLRNKCEILKAVTPSSPKLFLEELDSKKGLKEKFRSVGYAVSILGLLLSYKGAAAEVRLESIQKQVSEIWGSLEVWCLIPRTTSSCRDLKELVARSGFLSPGLR